MLKDAESAWRKFVEMHSAYSTLLNTLIEYFATKPPLWTDHTFPAPHPLVRRFCNQTGW
ncbi:MAG: hypothetical protein V7K40_34115 [Nostoc sp.]